MILNIFSMTILIGIAVNISERLVAKTGLNIIKVVPYTIIELVSSIALLTDGHLCIRCKCKYL